jgi:hypothetical protein
MLERKRWLLGLGLGIALVGCVVPMGENTTERTTASASSAEPTAEAAQADGAPPGCVLEGTSCRLFVQSCVYRCGEHQITQGCGACFGWWDPPPQ